MAAPIHATNEATLMIDPPPEAIIAGTPYLHPNATPLTLMSSVVSQIDASVSVTEPSWLIITPALLYRTCRPPKRSTAALTIASASASSDDVRVDVQRLPAGGLDLGGHRLAGIVGDVGEDDRGSLAREQSRGDHPHAARAAGDERNLPVEPSHRALPSCVAPSIRTRSVASPCARSRAYHRTITRATEDRT